jgi:hypothetical protein
MFRPLKLKPSHGWNAVAWDLAIVTVGVLIALVAQQIAENIHDLSLARRAESDIRSELSFDSAFAAERVAIGDCMRASIRDLQRRLLANGDAWPGLQNQALSGAPRALPATSLFAFEPPLGSPHRLWPTSAWASATGSGAVNDVGRDRFAKFAALYAMVNLLDRLQDHEIADHAKLMALNMPQRLDSSARLQLLTAIGAVDADNADAERLAAVFVSAARTNGIPPDRVWLRRVIRDETAHRGMCVKYGPALQAAISREFNGGSRI